MEEECKNCKYSTVKNKLYYCRRYPPQSIAFPDGTVSRTFPQVIPDEWCGEWKDKRIRIGVFG